MGRWGCGCGEGGGEVGWKVGGMVGGSGEGVVLNFSEGCEEMDDD